MSGIGLELLGQVFERLDARFEFLIGDRVLECGVAFLHRGMKGRVFFEELKRRNVYKVAIGYAAIGWLLIQVGSTLCSTFEAPGWIMKAFATIVIAGFPFALIIAWAFEMTPQGMKRTAD